MKKITISTLSGLMGAALGAGAAVKAAREKIDKAKSLSDKHLALFHMMSQWVKVKQEGKNLASYFEKKGYRKIAVYGMGYAGETLVDELEGSGVTVAYGIDKLAGSIYADIEIVSMDDELQEVDAVVVTAITFFEEIEGQLSRKNDCPVISLEDILYEI